MPAATPHNAAHHPHSALDSDTSSADHTHIPAANNSLSVAPTAHPFPSPDPSPYPDPDPSPYPDPYPDPDPDPDPYPDPYPDPISTKRSMIEVGSVRMRSARSWKPNS